MNMKQIVEQYTVLPLVVVLATLFAFLVAGLLVAVLAGRARKFRHLGGVIKDLNASVAEMKAERRQPHVLTKVELAYLVRQNPEAVAEAMRTVEAENIRKGNHNISPRHGG